MMHSRAECGGKSVYLAGAIEYAPDGGVAWRDAMCAFLAQELGVECFNPARKERDLLSDEEKANFRKWKTDDFPQFQQVIHRIIEADLAQLLHHTSFIVVLWDKFANMGTGTAGELTMAYHFGIPVYMVLDTPLEDTSSWILGCATKVFATFNELKQFLCENQNKTCRT